MLIHTRAEYYHLPNKQPRQRHSTTIIILYITIRIPHTINM